MPIKKPESNPEAITFSPIVPLYSLDNLVVNDSVKSQISDAAHYYDNYYHVFEIWGFKKTHGYSKRMSINLYGAPGTGKTMAAHAIAKHLKKKIIVVDYSEIESKYVGETSKNIRKVFDAAKKTNSVLLFDEADAMLSKRVTNMTQAVDVSVNQTRSVLLMLMNEYQIFTIFTTNFISNLDFAFLRRMAFHIKFDLPDEGCRKKLWRMYIPNNLPNNIDIDEIAAKYDGITGSDIKTAILNAAFKSSRLGLNMVDNKIVFEAVDSIIASKNANLQI